MSLLKKAFKVAGKVLKKAAPMVPGPIGTVAKVMTGAGAVAGVGSVVRAGLPAVRSLPGMGAVVAAAPRIGRAVGTAATGAAIYDAAGNLIGHRKRSRRINPLNHRALNRALRRVEKAKKAMKRVNAITIRKACKE